MMRLKQIGQYTFALGCLRPARGTITHFFVLFIFFFGVFALFSTVCKTKWSHLLDYDGPNCSQKQKSSSSPSTEIAFFLEPYEILHTVGLGTLSPSEFSISFGSVVNKRQNGDESTVNEALNTLSAASQSTLNGNTRRASILYEHALALQPIHPQVLVQYGLFVERVHSDVLHASALYTKALIHWPDDNDARTHFSRTLPLVEEIDSQMLTLLDQKREKFIRIPRTSQALKRLMRESYVEHIYHTVAIEGNTLSLLQTRSILETHMAVGGKSVMEHNEILGMDSALRFVNTTLIHKRSPLTTDDVLAIHQRVFGFVDPVTAGRYRRTQVYVGGFEPCGPDKVEREIEEFVDWLALDSTQRVHPVELAALVHYKFVIIHPFVDGNGRTARILMNLILMQAGFPPVIIRLDERAQYYETLKMANDGDLRPFIRFIASCTERTLESYIRFTTETLPTVYHENTGLVNISHAESDL